MTDLSRAIAVKPIIKYPREAQVGKTYLMTIDLQPEENFEWQYEEEEYPIYCEVDSDLFSSKSVGDPIIVLHRFGGSYGEARFLLTSVAKPEKGRIRIILINSYGVSFKILNLEDILLEDVVQHPEIVQDLKLPERIDIRAVFPEQWATLKNDLTSRDGTSFQQVIQRVETALTGESNFAALQETLRFFINLLQLVVDSQADVSQIYPVLAGNQEKLTDALLQVMSIGEPHWFNTNTNQAILIADVFVAFGNLIAQFPLGSRWLNLELAINAYLLALKVRTRELFPEDWAIIQNNLAVAFSNRIRGNRADNIEQAIACYQQALTVRIQTAMPIEWAQSMNNLATAYRNRIRGDRAQNIEDAIAAYQQSLQVMTREAMPIEWAQSMNNLATAYRNRIRGDRAENLEQAIAAYQQSLQVMTREAMPIEWAQSMNNLATAYRNRIRGDRAENLEQAIAVYQQSLQVMTREAMPIEWAQSMNNLATAYRNRIRGDRAQNIEDAIAAYQQSLQVMTREAMPIEWAQSMNNLATAYRDRIRGDRAENLEQAIAAYQQSLQVMTREAMPIEWAQSMNNLATAYRNRIRGDRAENLEQAIAAYQQSLQVMTREAMPIEWAQSMNNLATAYRNRIRGDRAQNIEDAIAAYQQSLQVMTREAMPIEWAQSMNNLATAYRNRIRGDRADNIEQAISAYQVSLEVFAPEVLPDDCRRTAHSLGHLYFGETRWQEAVSVYQLALQAAETLYQSASLLDSKAAELSEIVDLPRHTAYALARIGDLQKAVETLEQGRARGLSESLNRDRANLDQLQQRNPNIYTQYRTLTEQLRILESQQRDRSTSEERYSVIPESLRESAIVLRQQLHALIQEIRQAPGYENFLTLPTLEDVRRAVKSNRPLVYLVPTSAGSLALIVAVNSINSVWLDALNEAQLNNLLHQTWFANYAGSLLNEVQRNQTSPGFEAFANTSLAVETSQNQYQSDYQKWLDAIDSVTRQLWDPLMQPLISYLRSQNFHEATLVPTGFLSFLPLHAAWTEDPSIPTRRRYVLDDFHFTYAPNAKSLNAAESIANLVQADSILAIDNPRQDLPNSTREVQAAIASFPQFVVLRHGEATVAGVKSQLSKAAVVHFSCHGTANLNDPLNSGLVMSDGLLTLRDILTLDLGDRGGIRLAVLSACETGIPGIQLPDEVMSLPAGLMQAGAAGVVASLWSPSDLSTMLLFTKFYELWRNNNLPPKQALRQAQIWLRDSAEAEIAPLLGKPSLDPNNHPFSHPFYWAAFSYTGV